jgi:hypothetical protein
MTSFLSPQVELSNGRAVYLKPAEQGAPQVRASLTNRMMTPSACLIRAAQGAPRAPRRLPRHLHNSPSSHLAIFTPHLGTVRAHHGAPPHPPPASSRVPIHRRASRSHRAAAGRSERPPSQRRSPSRREIRSSHLTSSPQSGASPTPSSTERASTRRTCAASRAPRWSASSRARRPSSSCTSTPDCDLTAI